MAFSTPDFMTRHQFEGDSSDTHLTGIGTVITMFNDIFFVLWDSSGFIGTGTTRQGITRKEDATIRLDICGQVHTTDGAHSVIAHVEIVFDLPVDKYKEYKQVPVSVWEARRAALYTYLATTNSLTVKSGSAI